MPYESIPGTQRLASLLLTELDDGSHLGDNLMKLAGQIPVAGGFHVGNMKRYL